MRKKKKNTSDQRLQDATERRAIQDGKREALVAELRKDGGWFKGCNMFWTYIIV